MKNIIVGAVIGVVAAIAGATVVVIAFASTQRDSPEGASPQASSTLDLSSNPHYKAGRAGGRVVLTGREAPPGETIHEPLSDCESVYDFLKKIAGDKWKIDKEEDKQAWMQGCEDEILHPSADTGGA